ncbi:MAG: hypothetical protein RLO81_01515 [Fulvivirga sp.]|uniref:hypothetical protein n=1 Tax=Fulvivirga sp. TaxID=1931237 RepID=UPI0032EE6F45
MKKLFSRLFMVGALTGLLIASGCSDDDEVVTDPTDEFDVTLEFSNATASVNSPVVESYASGEGQTTFKARIMITSNDRTIRRVYVTRNLAGEGDKPFDLRDFGLSNKATKPDGSIDAEASGDATVDYTLDLPIPAGIGTNGSVVYKFWATNGRGDYRDPENSLAAGVGAIEVTVGTGVNPAAPVKAYTTTILAAPLDDGSSLSWISLLNGERYRISDGAEFGKLWDFGYYYGANGLASLASSYRFPLLFDDDNDPATDLVGISTLIGIDREELNRAAFALSSKTSADFDAATVAGDLNFVNLTIDATNSQGRINELSEGDIIDFVDNYGKKGIIRVQSISGTFSGQITIDIKVQP